MPITDKTRKILWGRSGSCCAICRQQLILEAKQGDGESIVGEECHIISGHQGGPRYDASFPPEKIDSYNNLILLCRIHHKMIDDQEMTYTANLLKELKSDHEIWVKKILIKEKEQKPVTKKRIKQNIPMVLSKLHTGKEILNLVIGTHAYDFEHDELKSQEEVDLIAEFLQIVQDWGDFGLEFEARDRVAATYDLTCQLKNLADFGFHVYGAQEMQIIEGGNLQEPSDWVVSIIRIVRRDSDKVQRNRKPFNP